MDTKLYMSVPVVSYAQGILDALALPIRLDELHIIPFDELNITPHAREQLSAALALLDDAQRHYLARGWVTPFRLKRQQVKALALIEGVLEFIDVHGEGQGDACAQLIEQSQQATEAQLDAWARLGVSVFSTDTMD